MGILSYLKGMLKSAFNTYGKIRKTIQIFKISYKSVWDAEFKDTYDIHQKVENILQTKIDAEHQNTFSYVRNRLIMDKDLTWDESSEVARDIFQKDLSELDDYEREVRGEYHVD